MNRFRAFIVALSLFFWCCTTAQAIASCTWVLWVNTLYHLQTISDSAWAISEVFDTRKECEEMQKTTWLAKYEKLLDGAEEDKRKVTATPFSRLSVTIEDKPEFFITSYQCLPDTLDPRDKGNK